MHCSGFNTDNNQQKALSRWTEDSSPSRYPFRAPISSFPDTTATVTLDEESSIL